MYDYYFCSFYFAAFIVQHIIYICLYTYFLSLYIYAIRSDKKSSHIILKFEIL